MRTPCAAGGFYPANRKELEEAIKECFEHELGPGGEQVSLIGGLVPHAGYVYSGPAAAWFYHHLKAASKKTVVFLGPNHTGHGSSVSVSDSDVWKTPLGEVKVDKGLRQEIVDSCESAVKDSSAHKFEHSIEVQLPFLQKVFRKPKIVPIAIATKDAEVLEDLGKVLSGLDCLVVASSDMSHYVSQEVAEEDDKLAIDRILNLDPVGLLKAVEENQISMCGVSAVAVMLWALKDKAEKAELLKYYTSGDVTGDKSSVVGYAAIAVR